MPTDDRLLIARSRFEASAWSDAYAGLSAVDHDEPLDSEDLERLAIAAHLLGRADDEIVAGSRAHLESVRTGDVARAVRTAFWLALSLFNTGENAQGGGWIGRAARLIEETGYDGPESGYLLVPQAIGRLKEGQPAEAFAIFEEIAGIAERFGDKDLVTLGRLGRGQSLIYMSEATQGVRLLDEVMVAVMAGEVSPRVAGIVYCSVIEACHELFDLRRAQEWTAALTRWCDSQPDLMAFRGQCQVYRAELMRFNGAWDDAQGEAERARDRLLRPPPEPAAGEALYQLAELERLRGASAEAEVTYREASQWGRQAEPGLALLRLSQGDVVTAARSIRRAVAEAGDDIGRATLLEPLVEISLAARDVGGARAAADDLAEIAERFDAPLLRAMATRSDGWVRLAEGDTEGALAVLRRAWVLWRELGAPYEAARVRVAIGRACRLVGDLDGARLEFDAARETFVDLGAGPELMALDRASGLDSAASPAGLSPREVEILRLVAAGDTNRAIAQALTISGRTVDRHVSNIFAKLDVSTRSAATAYAYEHGLV